MATTDTQASFRATRSERRGHILVSWLSSTDHKVIGYMYLITSFGFFLFGGCWR